MRKSNVITLAAAAAIVALSGGTGAYAATQIGGDSIQNNTLDTTEIQNGSLTGTDVDNGTLTGLDIKNDTVQSVDIENDSVGSADIKDASVQFEDLNGNVTDGIVADLKADAQIDSNGGLVATWSDNASSQLVVELPGTYNAMVYLDVQTTGTKPVKVQVGDVFCVATPVDGLGGQCQASRLAQSGGLMVTGADQEGVTVQVNVIRVD